MKNRLKQLQNKANLYISYSLYNKESKVLTYVLLPFTFLFMSIFAMRRFLFKNNVFYTYRSPVPVIVIGNITLGGTGKTPMVIWLVNFLQKNGLRPGVITRGYGGKTNDYPILAEEPVEAKYVGDEVLVIMRNTKCPVVIDPNRARGVRYLLANTDCNVIISDDGLQHYQLHREIEIALIDAELKLGNGYLLPAGPLREPFTRLKNVDFIVRKVTKHTKKKGHYFINLIPDKLFHLGNSDQFIELKDIKGKNVHIVTAIANPTSLVEIIREYAKEVITHIYPDHYLFEENDLIPLKDQMVIMTEKDAVKCIPLVGSSPWYYISVNTVVNSKFKLAIKKRLNQLQNRTNF